MIDRKKDSDEEYSDRGERDEGASSGRGAAVERQIKSNDPNREFDPKKTSS